MFKKTFKQGHRQEVLGNILGYPCALRNVCEFSSKNKYVTQIIAINSKTSSKVI